MRNAASIFFDREVDIERLSIVSGEVDTQAYVSHTTNIKCMIQSLDDSFSEGLTDGSYSKDFLMFCDNRADIDIIQSDKVIDGSTEYLIAGVEDYDFEGFKHKEIRLTLTQ